MKVTFERYNEMGNYSLLVASHFPAAWAKLTQHLSCTARIWTAKMCNAKKEQQQPHERRAVETMQPMLHYTTLRHTHCYHIKESL